MGFLDFLKPKKKKTFTTDFGNFTLIAPKYGIWAKDSDSDQINYFIRGDYEKPNSEQIIFLNDIWTKVEKLDSEIQQEFLVLYENLYEKTEFTHWKEVYEIHTISVISEEEWSISFFNKKNEKDDFDYNLLIENGKTKGFSIDS